ncbi:putative alpha/beta hydrolase domain-containing protein [Cladophialophora immunda]|nr:putative alpha/beta hydrolase domain-containing protein [Cladophialophora immunda]
MTGRGILANIRDVYAFICHIHLHDCHNRDEIVLIGFSRGAFTLLLDPYLPPYYRAILLAMIILPDDNPRPILDEATKVVEELEAIVIIHVLETALHAT